MDRSLSTLDKKSSMIPKGYHLLFSTLSALSSTGNSGIFLSGWNPVLFFGVYYIIILFWTIIKKYIPHVRLSDGAEK